MIYRFEHTPNDHVERRSWKTKRHTRNSDANQSSQRTEHLHALLVCSLAIGGTDDSVHTQASFGFDCLDGIDFLIVQELGSAER